MYGSCEDIVGEVSMNNTLDTCTQDLMVSHHILIHSERISMYQLYLLV